MPGSYTQGGPSSCLPCQSVKKPPLTAARPANQDLNDHDTTDVPEQDLLFIQNVDHNPRRSVGIKIARACPQVFYREKTMNFAAIIPFFLLVLAGCNGNSPTAPESIDDVGPVFLRDTVMDKGQLSYKIETQTATYYFQMEAGGFSGMVDRDGNDWISFNSAPGADGLYRGIPNLVNTERLFHPGFTNCRSRILSQTDSVIVISSEDKAGAFRCDWTIRSYCATMEIIKAGENYWFLYEGTPGGSFEKTQDYWLTSDGTRRNCDMTISRDLPGQEWICFGQTGLKRTLFLTHHQNDSEPDYYYPLANAMTVFGFGRYGSDRYLSTVPQHFTIGFLEDTLHSRLAPKINRIMASVDTSGD